MLDGWRCIDVTKCDADRSSIIHQISSLHTVHYGIIYDQSCYNWSLIVSSSARNGGRVRARSAVAKICGTGTSGHEGKRLVGSLASLRLTVSGAIDYG